MTMSSKIYDVIVVGGGPVGLAAAYEVAKADKTVLVLEQNNFFNQAGSSGDLARMFRTMYTEPFMADLAKKAMGLWDALEKDAGVSLRWMSGLLNFGDKDIGHDSPEGTLTGPICNLKRLNMTYKKLTVQEIEAQYPFKDLNPDWLGLYAPDNGVINVQQLLRSLLSLAKDYGAQAKQHTAVKKIVTSDEDKSIWHVHTLSHGRTEAVYATKKIIITCGSYVNHVLKPSFDVSLNLKIWEMVASYYNANAGPSGTIFPSMWFQFAPDKNNRSQLFYGMPAVPWGPPNVVRIAVDAATRTISDPDERQANILDPEDIRDTQDFIRDHIVGVDPTVPASTVSCLQTNVYDNMFVLDFLPKEYLRGGAENSIAIFTAGWAMKFVPLLGKALAEMALNGKSEYALSEFAITRKGDGPDKTIIADKNKGFAAMSINTSGPREQAKGSSIRR
ncbi:hypothetical protein B0J13DRAFT_490543 [Dactylonectria estremocensis]|uniref:FAD dependent oxidoreductase domain-containing protein n=1 Tax=Dactylonectria estremocensis TaxID=1079267 RepID=A0A9P9FH71_9HYPO|nr:hypothetical protein B0J13DRAFT_490543 [Dactylonectria estremocensis]